MDGFFTLDFAADPGGVLVEVNDAYCRLVGYSREELLQMKIADLEAAESPTEVARHKAVIMAAGADRFETLHRRKDGQEIHVEISVSRLTGSSERVFGFVRDITLDLYSAERDWMEPLLFCDVIDGQRREVAPAHPEGASPGRMRRIMQEGAELILRQPSDMQATESVPFGDASRPSASLMFVPLSREGKPVGVLSIQSYTPNAYTQEDLRALQALADYCAGALDRIRAEAALHEAHDLLEQRVEQRTAELRAANEVLRRTNAVLQAINQGTDNIICLKDTQGKIIMANPAMCRLLGKSESGILD